ncbi:MAG: diacylglycerol kinase family protein [Nitrosomonas sp.]
MNKTTIFSIRNRCKSFGYAFSGIRILIGSQHNAWIHALMSVIVIMAGFLFQVTAVEWMLLVFAITIVFIAEALNTAIELLCDFISPDYQELIKKTKDVAAGAVLIAAIGAAVTGLIIFLPYLRVF